MALSPGSRLGPYEILAPLGAGGMGEVYRARDTKLDREVAIKVLPFGMAEDAAALHRFEREAKAVAALSHPNILAIHDFGSSNGVTYAVMELLSGETLRQRLDHGALPVRRAIEIARDITLGLAAAHEKGVVHRDLKPGNLFLTKDGVVKILDFGLARRTSSEHPETTLTDRTEPGKILGTAGYMSPEQVRGESVDHRSDIFSFGAVLYEMLSGRRAFKGDTSVETMSAILHEEPPALSESGRQVPPAMERIVTHCLEKQAGDRFQSARDLAFDLGALSTVTSAPGHAQAIPPRDPWPRRALLGAAAIAFAALGAWAGDRYGRWQRPVTEPTFHRLTFRRGNLLSARFAPDGKTVVYGAAWEGKPSELFTVRTDSLESQPLGIPSADVLSVSSRGELAVLLKRNNLFSSDGRGTLARVPFGGGAPRELMARVLAAAWAPNGEDLAVIRELKNIDYGLEYPIGRLLFTSYLLRPPIAVSPDGELVAAIETEEDRAHTRIWAFSRSGQKRLLARLEKKPSGLAWSGDSRSLFFIGGKVSDSLALRAVDLSGRERVIFPIVGAGYYLHDRTPDGRLLIGRSLQRVGMTCRPAGEPERELSWLDGSDVRDISDDGRTILFREMGDGGKGSAGGVYLRRCDGSPAVRLGDGRPHDLSADGKWVLAQTGSLQEITLLPTGPGSPRKVPGVAGLKPNAVLFTPDDKRIAIWHSDEKGRFLLTTVGLDGGRPRTIPLTDMAANSLALSPDGSLVAYQRTDSELVTVPVAGGAARILPGGYPTGGLANWSPDGRFLYFWHILEMPGKITRREITTGETTTWLEIQPIEASGVIRWYNIYVTPDGRSYATCYVRVESSDLFVVDGLK